jgi:PPP family 3-phenylpropionic acid transporter
MASAPYHLLFGVLVRERGLPALVTGLGMGVGVGGEVLALLAFPILAGRLRLPALFGAAFAASAIRWALLWRAEGAAAVIGLQLLHGFTFGLFWGAAMSSLARLVPAPLRTTGQALFSAVVFGGGNALGYELSGLLYDRNGSAAPLFGWAAVIELALLGALLATPPLRRALGSAPS